MNSGGSGRRGRRGSYRPMADINVTPLVDVMLVLLIVFMVTAPMLTVAVPLDLPRTQAKAVNQDKEPLIISIDIQGQVYLQQTTVDLSTLVEKLRAVTGANPETRVFVRGDRGVPYGRIMEVMGTISAAGYNKVALVAELPKPEPAQDRPSRRR